MIELLPYAAQKLLPYMGLALVIGLIFGWFSYERKDDKSVPDQESK